MKQFLKTETMGVDAVSLDEAKTYMSIDHTDHDNLVLNLVAAAHRDVQEHCWHTLTDTTYKLFLNDFPTNGIIPMYRGVVKSVTSLTYYDENNQEQTLVENTDFFLSAGGLEPATIQFMEGVTVPETYDRDDAIIITYVAGYGEPEDVPDHFKRAILSLAHYWYDTPMDEEYKWPRALTNYLSKYRRMRFDVPSPIR